jgi:hypothetical protein
VALADRDVLVATAAGDLPDRFADLAICRNVLEYQLEPRNILVQLQRSLKTGGIISVHALYDPDFRRPRLKSTGSHYFSWNVQTLANLLTDAGFAFLEGSVRAYPREAAVISGHRNYRFAAVMSKLFDPIRQVQVIAKKGG